jgi:hypothetical protein
MLLLRPLPLLVMLLMLLMLLCWYLQHSLKHFVTELGHSQGEGTAGVNCADHDLVGTRRVRACVRACVRAASIPDSRWLAGGPTAKQKHTKPTEQVVGGTHQNTTQNNTKKHKTTQNNTIQYSTTQYNTTNCSTMSTTQHNTTQYLVGRPQRVLALGARVAALCLREHIGDEGDEGRLAERLHHSSASHHTTPHHITSHRACTAHAHITRAHTMVW